MRFLTRQEELVLLTISQLQGKSYLIRIMEFLTENTGKDWSISSVYVPLNRLAREGFLRETIGQSSSRRGGKAIKYYELSEDGNQILRELESMNQVMWKGLQFESEK